MRPAKLRRYVNDFLLPQLKIQDTISESTAHRWLKRLGFSLHRVQKGVYVDGHEREDVVAARNELMNYMYTMILPCALFFVSLKCLLICVFAGTVLLTRALT